MTPESRTLEPRTPIGVKRKFIRLWRIYPPLEDPDLSGSPEPRPLNVGSWYLVLTLVHFRSL